MPVLHWVLALAKVEDLSPVPSTFLTSRITVPPVFGGRGGLFNLTPTTVFIFIFFSSMRCTDDRIQRMQSKDIT